MSKSMFDSLPTPEHATAHVASISTLAASMIDWLPVLFALIPAVYYGILILESKTVQKMIQRRRHYKALRRRIKKISEKI